MQIAPDQIDPDAAKVVQRLRDNEHLAYLVGGCVRDLLLGRKPKDFDVVTSAATCSSGATTSSARPRRTRVAATSRSTGSSTTRRPDRSSTTSRAWPTS